MDLIEAIFIGVSRIAGALVSVFAGISGGDPATIGMIILLIGAGWLIGVRNSENRRGKFEAKQAMDRRDEYRRKGF